MLCLGSTFHQILLQDHLHILWEVKQSIKLRMKLEFQALIGFLMNMELVELVSLSQEYQNQAQAIARGEGIELRKHRSNLPLLVMHTSLRPGA